MDVTGDRSPRATAVAVALAGLVLAVTGAVAAATPVTDVELDVFGALNGAPALLTWPVWVVMQAGSLWGGIAVAVVVFGLLRDAVGVVIGVAAVVTAWLVAKVLKQAVDRGRPADVLAEIETHFEPVISGGGFPSGHSAVAFALATVISPALPRRWQAVPFVLASVVAFGRLLFGAHLPLDVIGGAALGVVVGGAALLATGRDGGAAAREEAR